MQHAFRHQLLCAVLASTWVTAATAQTSEEDELALTYGDQSSISIATGSTLPLRRAPSVASVITAEDIAAMGAKDLDEVLETVPGVHVSTTNRYFSTYQFRGIAGTTINPQVLVMQNGIPMNTLYRGDKGETWASQPLENVARIEVIRGPGSALYGADAYAGVINIITKTASDTPGTQLIGRGGSFNSWDTTVLHGGKWGALDVAAYAHVGSTDGMKEIVTADSQTARDTQRGTNASLAPGPVNVGYNATDANLDLAYKKWTFRSGYKLRDDQGTGAGASSALDPVGNQRGERINADLSWLDPHYAENWGMGVILSYLHFAEQEYLQLSPPGTRFAAANIPANVFTNGMIGNPERYERQTRLSGFVTYAGFAGHSVRLGLGHDDLDMYKTATHKNYFLLASGAPSTDLGFNGGEVVDYSSRQPHLRPQQRRVDYVYGQDEWSFAKDWTLTAGVRHDQYSDFGGTTNPRVALVWDATNDLTAKLLYGQAFRAPSFTEQYGINPVGNGNPDLKPEKINTLETAFAWQARRDTEVNLSFFRYDMNNVIRVVTNPVAGTGGTFQNTGSQHGSGMELESTWDAGNTVRLTGGYSYQKSVDDATGQDAGYAPRNHLYARADWRFTAGWLSSTQINRVADRQRAAGDTRSPVPDYTTVDLNVRTMRNKKDWDIAATVRNLFNADVREPSIGSATPSLIPNDLPMAGRSVWLQAIYKL